MNNTMIEVKKLEKSPLNVRKTAAGIDDLLASIPKHGLMLNLNVYPGKKGKYFVFAGSRRLAALKALQAEGHFAADYAVPCRIYTKEEAHELSLVENTVRQAMHPADEFTAFAALIEQGHTVEQVSNRFGCTAKLVEQRLTLGKAAPELLDAYRAEKLTLECLMAFTVTDDHAKQMQVYASLEEWHSARDIRAMLTDEMAEAKSKLARFVGLDAYHAAGGVSRADLFGEQVYLENPDLLHQLAGEALETTRQTLAAEGWKWVEVSPDRDWSVIHGCSRIRPQPVDAPPELLAAKAEAEAELEAITEADGMDGDDSALAERQEAAETALADIEQKLESFVAYDPDEMSQAGCYVSIDKDGKLSVEKGLVRREDAKQLAGDGDARRAKPGGMPATLQRNLEGYRLQAAQVEIARNRLVALDLWFLPSPAPSSTKASPAIWTCFSARRIRRSKSRPPRARRCRQSRKACRWVGYIRTRKQSNSRHSPAFPTSKSSTYWPTAWPVA